MSTNHYRIDDYYHNQRKRKYALYTYHFYKIYTTVLPPLQSCAPQFTTTPKLNITKSPTTSLGLESCSGNKPGVSTQGNGSSNTISALDALLGLSLLLLALVSIGWVWTCWTASGKEDSEVNINSKTNE